MGRGASGLGGWVLTRRRGGAEKEAEKQGKKERNPRVRRVAESAEKEEEDVRAPLGLAG